MGVSFPKSTKATPSPSVGRWSRLSSFFFSQNLYTSAAAQTPLWLGRRKTKLVDIPRN
jgi:hypothetical protein